MGICLSTHARTAKAKNARSDAIDLQILENSKRFKREVKVLLLGLPESGKSMIVAQMKISCENGLNHEELMTFRPIIYRNTLDSAQAIVFALQKINIDWINPINQVNANRILDYHVDAAPSFVFSEEIAKAIHQLWQDPIISKVMSHRSEFYLMDNANYFLNEVLRIGTHKYIPTESDVLRAQAETTGITETRFHLGQLQIRMIDVCFERSNRHKWMHCFENVTSVIFCTALSDYDQVLLERKNQNRMAESLTLFESVVNSRWFLRTSIILFLTKVDVFKNKIPKVPLERYFPEYTGGADISKAVKYILWKFMHANRARLSIYPHLMQATDRTAHRLIFTTVKETILQNALNGSTVLVM